MTSGPCGKGDLIRGLGHALIALLAFSCGPGQLEAEPGDGGSEVSTDGLAVREGWSWEWVTAYYHPFNGEKDMGPNTAVCGKAMDLYADLKYFALSEQGTIWQSLVGGAKCDPESWGACHPGDDCSRFWNYIPAGYRKGTLGVDAQVRLPNCDNVLQQLCGKRFEMMNPVSGHKIRGYIGDICPNEHWNNKMANNCQAGQNVLDLYVETYKVLGGSFKDNIKVHLRPTGDSLPLYCQANSGKGYGLIFDCGNGQKCAKTDETYTTWCVVR